MAIVPIVGGAAVVGFVAYRKRKRLRQLLQRKLDKKIVAIVGDVHSGKTTLTQFLAHGVVGDSEYVHTMVDTHYPGRKVKLANGTVLHFGDMRDVPGEKSAWGSWENRVQESDYILYLLQSPLLRSGNGATIARCRRDLQQLVRWLNGSDRQTPPIVILVFTFRDQDTSHRRAASTAYAGELIAMTGLRPHLDAIMRVTSVKFASGSLAEDKTARELVEEIGAVL